MSSKRATMERLPFHFMSGFSSRLRGFVIILTALVYVSLVMLLEEDMSGGGEKRKKGTYVVCGLLVFVSLFVSGSLLLIGDSLLVAQGLPPLSEDLANLAYTDKLVSFCFSLYLS